MRLSALLLTALAFGSAGAGAYYAAGHAATWLEDISATEVDRRLGLEGHSWSSVDTDGLQVIINGEAPTEADRFKALAAAGTVVEAARIIDNITITATQDLARPEFSLEILRNDAGVSLIGLIPVSSDRDALLDRIQQLAGDAPVSDFMETADYEVPDEWPAALSFGLNALEDLDRAKISIAETNVQITAIGESLAQKARLESQLARRAPANISTEINISAPRPVITPFTLRFRLTNDRIGFDACSTDTDDATRKIMAAAVAAGMDDKANCQQGLGVPSPKWGDAAATAIAALTEVGGGTVTLTDADVALIATPDTDAALFDRVTSQLEADLPPLFALTAVLPKPEAEDASDDPIQFSAERGEDGTLQMRGDVGSDLKVQTVESFAQSKFGSDKVLAAIGDAPNLPNAWAIRVMAGLEGLSELVTGSVVITEDNVEFSGTTGSQTAGAEINKIMTSRLGDGVNFKMNVTYIEALDPIASLLDPAECIARVIALTDSAKISFEPGSVNLDSASRNTVDDIAEILSLCPEAEVEISGHTDSQGGEEMNKSLSQDRADAVLAALRIKRVKLKSLTAQGYGETQPIADNSTAEGREANRRIEFRLVSATPVELPIPEDTPAEEDATDQEGQANE